MEDFRKKVLKVNGPRKHKLSNSLGVYDAYKYIRKNKWLDIGRPLTEHEFYSIIRKTNNYLAEELLKGNDVILPHRLGTLELRKYYPRMYIEDGVYKNTLPIDWDVTLKLWSEDEEAYKERTLVKMEEKEIFKVQYNKNKANYNNKSFMEFVVNRDIKRGLKQHIKRGAIDAFEL